MKVANTMDLLPGRLGAVVSARVLRPAFPVLLPLRIACALLPGLLGGLLGGGRLHGEDLFPRPETLPIRNPAEMILVADLDGDGLPDVALAHEAFGEVTVALKDPRSGGFSSPTVYGVGLSPVWLAAGDLDRDGDLDLAIANYGSASVSILLNDGVGRFTALPEVPAGPGQPRSVRFVDLDRDGNLDLVVTRMSSDTFSAHLGDGTGSFRESQVVTVGQWPHTLVVADFDGNGTIDVAVPCRDLATGLGHIYWYEGLGDGTFRPRLQTQIGGRLRYSVDGDFDADGRPDLVVIDLDGRVSTVLNRGAWSFEVRPASCCGGTGGRVDTATWYGFLRRVDIDGDGDLDVLARFLSVGGLGGFRVFENDGTGLFVGWRDVTLVPDVGSVDIADFDGDGVLDAVATSTRPVLSLVHGKAPGSFDGPERIPISGGVMGVGVIRPQEGDGPSIVAFSSQSVHLLERGATGGYVSTAVVPAPTRSLQAMLVADLDGVPGDEVALADVAGEELIVAQPSPDGSLGPWLEYAVGGRPGRMASGDFDGDGLADVAVVHMFTEDVEVLYGPLSATDGGGRRLQLQAGARVDVVRAADVSLDGAIDLLVSTEVGIVVFLSEGEGFAPGRLVPLPGPVTDFIVTDLQGDGLPDLVAAGGTDLFLLRGLDSLGGPPTLEELPLGFSAWALSAGDVDGDGRPDLVAVESARKAIAVLLFGSSGELAAPQIYDAGSSLTAPILEDLDADGRLDVAIGDLAGTLCILYGRRPAGAPFLRGDADLDGRASLTDAIRILGRLFLGWEPSKCLDAEDVDDDGKVDLTDAVQLLLHLFRGGDPPPAPGLTSCGPDPTADDLGVCAAASCP